MDNELVAVLREIADALKERNETTRLSKEGFAARSVEREQRFEDSRKANEEKMAKMREDNEARMVRLREESEKRSAENAEYQNAILTELRRLNDNLESLVSRSESTTLL